MMGRPTQSARIVKLGELTVLVDHTSARDDRGLMNIKPGATTNECFHKPPPGKRQERRNVAQRVHHAVADCSTKSNSECAGVS
jgi:hypothetical protein